MKKINLAVMQDQIIGLRPIYTDTGNATQVYLREGEVIDPRRVEAIQILMARNCEIDLRAQRQRLAIQLNRGGTFPFCLDEGRVFIPLKMRRPLTPGDSSYGFIDFSYIADVIMKEGIWQLALIDGRQIPLISKRSTILQMQQIGNGLRESQQTKKSVNLNEQIAVSVALYLVQTLEAIRQAIDPGA